MILIVSPTLRGLNIEIMLKEFEGFFSKVDLPKQRVPLSICETIIDCKLFVDDHLNIVRNNIENKRMIKPYIERLEKFKNIIESEII